ncbi:SseB family protein [Actinacidiphila sp. bgisy167]|uniref:SseB family protein n=1 Tax=Actinacidiphila sp. bgisy167 TaxID=3413797 RepID=UPI003D7068AB
MTDFTTPNGAQPPAQRALHEIATGGDNAAALTTLAASDILLPVPGPPEEPAAGADGEEQEMISLPVFEQEDGTKLVPVFTSEVRLAHALPNARGYRVLPLAALSNGWPSDDLTLAIDAGSPDTLTIRGEGVRALAGLSG